MDAVANYGGQLVLEREMARPWTADLEPLEISRGDLACEWGLRRGRESAEAGPVVHVAQIQRHH